MKLPSHKHILVWCKQCKKHEIIETYMPHYCSKQCHDVVMKTYWKNRYLIRKNDPVAKEHVRKAKAKYYAKNKNR